MALLFVTRFGSAYTTRLPALLKIDRPYRIHLPPDQSFTLLRPPPRAEPRTRRCWRWSGRYRVPDRQWRSRRQTSLPTAPSIRPTLANRAGRFPIAQDMIEERDVDQLLFTSPRNLRRANAAMK